MLTIILTLFGLGVVATVLFAGLSWYSHRDMTHVPSEEDTGKGEAGNWLVEVVCNWQDRNALRIGQLLLFWICLQVLRACLS